MRGRTSTALILAATASAALVLGGCVSATPSTLTTSESRTSIVDGTATVSDIRAAIAATSSGTEAAQVRSSTTLELAGTEPGATPKSKLPRVDTSISGITTLDGAYADLTVDLGLTRVKPVQVALRGDTAWIKNTPKSPWVENPSLTQARKSITMSSSMSYFTDTNPVTYHGSELLNSQRAHKYTTTGNVTAEVAQALIASGAIPALEQTTPTEENYTASIWLDQQGRAVRVEVEVPVLSILAALADQNIDISSVSSAIATHTLSLRNFGKHPAPTQQPPEK